MNTGSLLNRLFTCLNSFYCLHPSLYVSPDSYQALIEGSQVCEREARHPPPVFMELPKEIWGHIFTYLRPSDIYSVQLVCTIWKTFSDSELSRYKLPVLTILQRITAHLIVNKECTSSGPILENAVEEIIDATQDLADIDLNTLKKKGFSEAYWSFRTKLIYRKGVNLLSNTRACRQLNDWLKFPDIE